MESQPRLTVSRDDVPLHAGILQRRKYDRRFVGVDVHKKKSQIAVIDDNGEVEKEVRVLDANLDEITQKYAGSEAAIEATSKYFTIYDTLDVTLANPLKVNWFVNQKKKTDCVDAKNPARFLRMSKVPGSYVPPRELRKHRALARGWKKLMNKQNDF